MGLTAKEPYVKEHILYRETYGKSTNCICPKCGKSHKLKINYTGRGIPKKFCGNCQIVTSDYDVPECQELSKSMYRWSPN